MAATNRDQVNRGLELLYQGLYPFVVRELEDRYGNDWISKAEEALQATLKRNQDGEIHLDVAQLLRLMFFRWNEVFGARLGQSERSIVSQLRETRNRVAHQQPFDSRDAHQALDNMHRLLTTIGAPGQDDLDQLRREALRALHADELGAEASPMGFDFSIGRWHRRSDTLLEITAVPHGAGIPSIAESGVQAIALDQDQEDVSILARTLPPDVSRPSGLVAGDVVLLIDRDRFHLADIPVSLTLMGRAEQQPCTILFTVRLGISDARRFAIELTRQVGYGVVAAGYLGLLVASDSAVQRAVDRVRSASPEHTISPEAIRSHLERALGSVFGLEIIEGPTDIRVDGAGVSAEQVTDRLAPAEGMPIADYWRLVRKIGSGSFSDVWLAEHIHVEGFHSAVKFVNDDRWASMIEREARRAIRLQQQIDRRHLTQLRNVLPGPPVQLLYEFVDGPDLGEYVAEQGGRLPEYEAVAIARQILAGLDEMHRVGLIHRDLHAGNIKIERGMPELLVRILDYGFAAFVPTHADYSVVGTETMALQPTHPFAEPASDRDFKTDLYSVGVLLWWMVTGQTRLPPGSALYNAWAAVSENSSLLDVIQRACIEPREARFPSARVMFAALDRIEFPLPELSVQLDGSGTHDSLEAALQVALPGQTVRLGEGIFALRRGISLTSPIQLCGAGPQRSIVQADRGAYILHFDAKGSVKLSDLGFHWKDGQASESRIGVSVDGGEFDIRRCSFRNAQGPGTEKVTESAGLVIGNEAIGIVADCYAEANTIGILAKGSSRVEIRDCTCQHSSVAGIYASEHAHVSLISNTCNKNDSGIHLEGSAEGIVHGNTCDSNVYQGIAVWGRESSVLIEHNTCVSNTTGIEFLFGSTTCTIRNNQCINSSHSGILISDECIVILDSNSCIDNHDAGIHFTDASSGQVTNNSCRRNTNFGILVSGTASPILEHNICSDSSIGICFCDSAAGQAFQNDCSDNKTSGIACVDHTNPVLDSNSCKGNLISGIAFVNTAGGIARRNLCIQNRDSGIKVLDRSSPALDSNLCSKSNTGIGFFGHAAGTAQVNEIEHCSVGILLRDDAQPELKSNTCKHNRMGFVFTGHSGGLVHRNNCEFNESHGMALADQAAPHLKFNSSRENHGVGIRYSGSAAGIACENTWSQNKLDGIYVSDRANPTLENNICQENERSGIRVVEPASPTLIDNRISNNGGGDVKDWRVPS